MRNALSERDENWETTIAVEVAATTANAAPSHQRTPMKRRFMLTGYADTGLIWWHAGG
jgi:hypothetical protein